MNIHFSLRKQGNKHPKIILQVFDPRLEGRKFMLSTGIAIDQAHWDKRKQRMKPIIPKAVEYTSLNRYMDRLEQIVIDFKSDNHRSNKLSRASLKAYIERALKNTPNHCNTDERKSELFDVWQDIICNSKNSAGNNVAKNTLKSKMQTLRLVKRFAFEKRKNLTLQAIDMQFYYDFDDYMKSTGLSGNSRGKHFKEIKAIMREAIDRDYAVNLAFQKKSFKVIRTEPDSVFLNDEEIRKVISTTLPPKLEKLKDLFVMACFVGARHSDWHKINRMNIVVEKGKEILKMVQQKTNDITHVPVHPVVKMILSKYSNGLPRVVSNQKFNDAIKEICKSADLGKATIGNRVIDKWTEITTHTARRSFATNAYLSKSMDVYQIMKCTGHKTESSFLRYLKLNGKDFAIQAADSSFFTNDSYMIGSL